MECGEIKEGVKEAEEEKKRKQLSPFLPEALFLRRSSMLLRLFSTELPKTWLVRKRKEQKM